MMFLNAAVSGVSAFEIVCLPFSSPIYCSRPSTISRSVSLWSKRYCEVAVKLKHVGVRLVTAKTGPPAQPNTQNPREYWEHINELLYSVVTGTQRFISQGLWRRVAYSNSDPFRPVVPRCHMQRNMQITQKTVDYVPEKWPPVILDGKCR